MPHAPFPRPFLTKYSGSRKKARSKTRSKKAPPRNDHTSRKVLFIEPYFLWRNLIINFWSSINANMAKHKPTTVNHWAPVSGVRSKSSRSCGTNITTSCSKAEPKKANQRTGCLENLTLRILCLSLIMYN